MPRPLLRHGGSEAVPERRGCLGFAGTLRIVESNRIDLSSLILRRDRVKPAEICNPAAESFVRMP
ncbi:hypothetical protein [Roseomonas sp. HF4]|uniref:hypothetical protein n=1 Tax=Roseomonas sp. HF4 TaxID=2562313 RepID=UPI0010C0E6BE|nr:hypothetical protein [Roseomonas sp. HF4]